MVNIEFVHVPDGRSIDVGPFEWIQVTYDLVRAEPIGGCGDPDDLAMRQSSGFWEYDGLLYTDFIIGAVDKPKE